jgi:NADP-dependent 3-hydroxy acid dehydrogenase YdfG
LDDAGHDVVLHARNADRLTDQPVLEHVYDVVYGDLSNLDETVRVAEEANRIGSFDAVIHNAGVMHGPTVLAVNTIAPFTLTAIMSPPEGPFI